MGCKNAHNGTFIFGHLEKPTVMISSTKKAETGAAVAATAVTSKSYEIPACV